VIDFWKTETGPPGRAYVSAIEDLDSQGARMRRARILTVTSVAALAVSMMAAVPAAQAQSNRAAAALADPIVIQWDMNEPAGATVMQDSGALGINGTIGSEVETGYAFDGAIGYRFPRLVPNTPPTHPEHLVRVEDRPELDPGTSPYTIEIRYKTTNPFGNIIQKGQSHTAGGQFKMQLPGGRPQCYFKGSNGRVGVGYKTPIDDGVWHVVRCVKDATAVSLYVDGVRVARHVGDPGNMDNTFPLTIGGKPACDQIKVTCDYFGGVIDYVTITKG
jgi:hypothetical protein